jgi:isopentenyl-diphosphate Delta-isomerase
VQVPSIAQIFLWHTLRKSCCFECLLPQVSAFLWVSYMQEEEFDIVDEANNPTGEKALRSKVHATGLWHRTAHVYFFRKKDADIEFLVHLRASTKDLNPNMWDTRFGGHVQAGETVTETAVSEVKDEVDLVISFSDLLQGPLLKREKYPNNEFTQIYYYSFEGSVDDLEFHDGEVQKVRWMSAREIQKSMKDKPDRWSASLVGFEEVLAFLKSSNNYIPE